MTDVVTVMFSHVQSCSVRHLAFIVLVQGSSYVVMCNYVADVGKVLVVGFFAAHLVSCISLSCATGIVLAG